MIAAPLFLGVPAVEASLLFVLAGRVEKEFASAAIGPVGAHALRQGLHRFGRAQENLLRRIRLEILRPVDQPARNGEREQSERAIDHDCGRAKRPLLRAAGARRDMLGVCKAQDGTIEKS